MQVPSARRSLIRDAVIYTPAFLFILALWVSTLNGVIKAGGGGGIILLALLTFVAFLAGFQSIQSLRDLRSSPITSEGPISRRWKRSEMLFFPAYYIRVNKGFFRIPHLMYEELEKEDIVRVSHFPHTATVVAIERVRRGGGGRKE